MAEHYRFFDSVDPLQPDRTYNAQEFTDYFEALVTSGVMKGAGNQLLVSTDGSTMISSVDTGIAFLVGRFYENDSLLPITHEIETVGKNRIDRIVVRMDLSPDARNVKIFVKKGVASTNPIAPTLVQTISLYEISLAQVLIVGGQTFIDATSITDERGIDIICPWAGSNILPNFNDAALEDLVTSTTEHMANMNNPHQVTAAQIIPEISTYPYHRIWYINPTTGNDANDGLSAAAAFKTIDKLTEQIKPIILGTTEIIMSEPVANAENIFDALGFVRSSGLIEIDFGGSIWSLSLDIEGCGAPLKLKNFVTSDRMQFRKCAPVFIENPTFNLVGYVAVQEVLLVSGGIMDVYFPTFNNATTNTAIMYAGEAATMSATGSKFANCSATSRAFSASNSVVMHMQTTTTGPIPILKTEYGGGRVFTQV